jgi:outer membrane protein OmpA-like peptidoglycan-associated protein
MLCFLNVAKEKPTLDLHIKFEPTDGELKEPGTGGDSKIVDLRKQKSNPALNILIRDVETGNPIIANMTISGIKDVSALYSGSDFFISIEKSGKIQLKVDAEGYFFVDREEPVSASSDNELVIWMEPLGEGKSMQIDEIEFVPGTSEFLSTAEPKLKRLKDFLALNSNVKVEIQGHVNATGENTFAAQKLSEARAKRVLNYLVENGISKERLTAVGFGNTKPIYPEAKFAYEEQANRRVEIKVL